MPSSAATIYADYAAVYAASGQSWLSLHLWSMLGGWLDQHGWRGSAIVDLGCGVGTLAVELARLGYHVTGVDRARAMLDQARLAAQAAQQSITWLHADLTEWSSPRLFDLALSCYDTFNYLTNLESLTLACQRAAQQLSADGYLIFDVNTPLEYAAWPERATLPCDQPDLLIYNVLDFDADTRLAHGHIVWFQDTGAGWQRGSEDHLQRAHSDAEIVAALTAAGLTLTARLDISGAPADLALATRVVYIARRSAYNRGSPYI